MKKITTSIVKSLFHDNKPQQALSKFNNSPNSYDGAFLISGEKFPLDECVRIFNKVKQPNIILLTTFLRKPIEVPTKRELWKKVDEIIQKMTVQQMKNNINSYLWNFIIKEMCQYNFQLAIQYFKLVKNENLAQLEKYTLNELLNSCSGFGTWKEAESIFRNIEVPDKFHYSCYIKTLVKAKQVEKALDVVLEMRRNGIEPDRVPFVVISTGCNTKESALKLEELIINSGLSDDIIIQTSLISMFSKCGLLERSIELFHTIEKKPTQTWNAMLSSYSHYCRYNEVLLLFSEMKEASVDKQTLIYVILALSSLGKYQSALELLLSKTALTSASHYHALIKGCINNSNFHQSLKVLDIMKSKKIAPTPQIFVSLVNECIKSGTLDEANVLHQEIIENLPDFMSDSFLVVSLINLLGCFNESQSALSVFSKYNGQDVAVLNVTLSVLYKNGLAQNTIDLFSKNTKTFKFDEKTFTIILTACKDLPKDSVALGLQYFEMMKQYEIEPNIFHYTCLIKCFLSEKKIERALDILFDIRLKGIQIDDAVYSSFIEFCTQ